MPTLTQLITGKTAAEIAQEQQQGPPVPVFRLTDKDGAVYDITAPDQAAAENELIRMKGGGAQAPEMGTGEDVARSLGTGVMRGGAGLLGLPGDLKRGMDWGVNKVTDAIFGAPTPEQEAIRNRVQTLGLPTSQAIRDVSSAGAEALNQRVPDLNLPTSLHEPQTTAGKYAETVGEFLPGAVAGPVGGVRQAIPNLIKYGVVPGLTSEGAGQQAQKLFPGNQVIETGARILGGAGGAAASAGASRLRAGPPPAPGVNPAERIGMANEFRVPLTRGQATGNFAQQAFEESARGAKSDRLRNFDQRQAQAIREGGGTIHERLAGGFAPVETTDTAGQMLADSLREKVALHKAEADRLYKSSEAKGTVVDQNAAANILDSVTQKLAVANHPPFDRTLHPSALAALKDIKELGDIGAASSTGVGLNQIEMIRQRFNHYSGVSSQDARAVGLVKKAFDGWLDDSINNKLFSGDPIGLAELKAARGQSSAAKKITDPKDGDLAGQRIADMLQNGRTGQEIGNWLVGSTAVNPPAVTVRVAAKIKQMFGPGSEEWAAVRQAAWVNLMKQSETPKAIAKNIGKFTEGNGRSLAQMLYSKEEIDLMRRYGSVAGYTVPEGRAAIAGKSPLGQIQTATMMGLATLLGFKTGGLSHAVASAVGSGAAKNAFDWWRMGAATNPKVNAPLFDARAAVGQTALTGEEALRQGVDDLRARQRTRLPNR